MAKKLIFIVNEENSVEEKIVEYKYIAGNSSLQKSKNVCSLHDSIKKEFNGQILEISSKSYFDIGKELSAFNLKVEYKGKKIPIENIYQSSKVFENDEQFTEILNYSPLEAKRCMYKSKNKKIVSFRFDDKNYPITPSTLYYNYIYCRALKQNHHLIKEIIKYNIFTDIEFNYIYSVNCQARAVAIYLSLYKNGLLEEALSSIKKFERIVYKKNNIKID